MDFKNNQYLLLRKDSIQETMPAPSRIYDTSSLENLVGELREKIGSLWSSISRALQHHSDKGKDYSLVELDDQTCMLLSSEIEGEVLLNIGFPFPIFSEPLNPDPFNLPKGTKFFLRGEPVRTMQRTILFNMSDNVRGVTSTEMLNLVNSSLSSDNRPVYYVDPYRFIGDSIIGLYYPEAFIDRENRNLMIFSQNHAHLRQFYPSHPLTVFNEKVSPGGLIIMPDLIDNQWESTIDNLGSIPDNSRVIIPGRGIYVQKENGRIDSYWNNTPDFLLNNRNIEDYMMETLKPFKDAKQKQYGLKERQSHSFWLNPFGSTMKKAIPLELAVRIYLEIMNLADDTRLSIIGGYHDNNLHHDWVHNFLKALKSIKGIKGRLSINYYSDLTHLAKDLEESGCSCVISADTSISHFVNRLGYFNITLYNKSLWDPDSIQSMTSDSPLGFCRFFNNQIPVLVTNTDYSRLAKNISALVTQVSKGLSIIKIGKIY